jgi:NAD(P)-dependent dehydrogenase (short-subunit alcohol dehydrogenase family)
VLDVGALRRVFETNVFGAYRVTAAMLPLLRKSRAGRIVNVSSALGSLGRSTGPAWELAGRSAPAYSASKTALNALTVHLAALLRGSRIKVNAVCPGYVATDLNAHRGRRSVEQGARIALRMAILPEDGPTGGFFNEAGPIPW